eukprot:gene18907-20810_t
MVIVLKIIGFPIDATTRDLKDLFRGLRIREEDLHIGREKGEPAGFAVFSDDDAARRATMRSGQTIGPKRVKVMLSSSAEMDSVLNKRFLGPGPRDGPSRSGRGGGFSSPPLRGRGRGRGYQPDRFHYDRSDRDFDSRHERPGRVDRSHIPDLRLAPRAGGSAVVAKSKSGLDEIKKHSTRSDVDDFSERKFVKLTGLPYTVTDLDIQNFFRGILTREVYVFKHEEGRFAGRPNGDAIIEFFSEQDARGALERDGRRLGSRIVFASRPRRDEIKNAMRSYHAATARPSTYQHPQRKRAAEPTNALPDISSLSKNKEELSNLMQLFKTMIAAVGGSGPEPEQEARPRHSSSRRESIDDPVIRRVARNANINMRDIGEAKVVGIRNLPFSITPEEVINFFRGYAVIPDSVRIHYSEDGRSSGDAIITFRTTRDAEKAVADLNRKSIGKRKVELFIM